MSRPLAFRTARRLARAVAALAGFAFGAALLDRPGLAALPACLAVAIALTLVLHLVRQSKGTR